MHAPSEQRCDPASREYDIAVANLQAAVGLPGAENLNIPRCLDWLDDVANRIRIETLCCSYLFRDHPEEFENCPAHFCMAIMSTVLGEDLGLRYNPDRIQPVRPIEVTRALAQRLEKPKGHDCRDWSIHGLIEGPGGTCASMPVLQIALGRRLGYPLKLVSSKVHYFVRWDDPLGTSWSPGARFNVETTCVGFVTRSDEHYRKWPYEIEPWEVDAGHYLRSMTHDEEVATLRGERALCLWANDRHAEAMREFRLAYQVAPRSPLYLQLGMLLYKRFRLLIKGKTRNQVLATGLTVEDEDWIQRTIAWFDEMRLRHGLPGIPDLEDYGIRRRLVSTDRSGLPCKSWRPSRPLRHHSHHATAPSPASSPCPIPACQPPVLTNAEQVKRLHEFNCQNQERLRQGLGGLNPKDFGL